MKLFSYWRSSAAWRGASRSHTRHPARHDSCPPGARWRAAARESYHELNPQERVPALEDEGRFLAQSLAIIEYLEETHPSRAPARGLRGRAIVRQMALLVACEIPRCRTCASSTTCADRSAGRAPVADWVRHWIGQGFVALEELARRHGDGMHYLYGARSRWRTVPGAEMYNARRYHLDLKPYPVLVAIDTHLTTLPASRRRPRGPAGRE